MKELSEGVLMFASGYSRLHAFIRQARVQPYRSVTKIRVYQTCNSLKLRYLRNRGPRSDPNYTVALRHAGTAHGPSPDGTQVPGNRDINTSSVAF